MQTLKRWRHVIYDYPSLMSEGVMCQQGQQGNAIITSSETFQHLLPPANEVWGKVIFSEACVKNSVHRGGVCLIACWDTPPPDQRQVPPGNRPPSSRADTPRTDIPAEQTPPEQTHPPEQTPWQQTPPPRAVHAGRYGQQAGGTYPTGMQSCL